MFYRPFNLVPASGVMLVNQGLRSLNEVDLVILNADIDKEDVYSMILSIL